jgi:hypothetical protein
VPPRTASSSHGPGRFPFVIVYLGNASFNRGYRIENGARKTLDGAVREIHRQRALWFGFFSFDYLLWTWTVVDARTGQTKYEVT